MRKQSPAATISALVLALFGNVLAWLVTKSVALTCLVLLASISSFVIYYVAWPYWRRLNLSRLLSQNPCGIVQIYGAQEPAEGLIAALAERAHCIDVLTVRGFGIVGLSDALLRRATALREAPAKVRVLLLNPAGVYLNRRASELGEDSGAFRQGVETTIRTLLSLKQTFGTWEIGLYDELPVWRLIRLDGDVFVSTYPANGDGHRSAMYHITDGPELSLFASFTRLFESLWENRKHAEDYRNHV